MTAAMPANGSGNSGVGSEWNTDAVVSPYVQMKEVLPLSESISVANENYFSEYYPCRTRFLSVSVHRIGAGKASRMF